MKKNLYGLIYTNNKDFLYFVVFAESWFDAERKAKEDVKKWDGFRVYAVNFIQRRDLDTGEVTFVGG